MEKNRGLVLRIQPDATAITVEQSGENGEKVVKKIAPDTLLDCIAKSSMQTAVSSGLLPLNCISYSFINNERDAVSLVHPELYADISYYKTLYRHFPLPRLVFRFELYQGHRVSSVSVGVVKDERLSPDTVMYHYPFSNVSGFHMCIGSNAMPKYDSLHALSSLPYFILAIPNNDDHYRADYNKLKLGYRDLLEHMKDKEPSCYYSDILVPSGRTLKDFIKANSY